MKNFIIIILLSLSTKMSSAQNLLPTDIIGSEILFSDENSGKNALLNAIKMDTINNSCVLLIEMSIENEDYIIVVYNNNLIFSEDYGFRFGTKNYKFIKFIVFCNCI